MKAILFAAVAVALCSACQPQGEQTQPGAENEKLVRTYFDLFNQHEWKQMADLYADTTEFKDPSLGPGIVKQSRQQTIAKYTELSGVFPNLRDELVQIYPSGDKHIVVEFVSRGTASDQSTFELPICTIFTIEKGKIVKDFTYYDNFEDPQAQP
jgi:ketosteroid isomerase-like protein